MPKTKQFELRTIVIPIIVANITMFVLQFVLGNSFTNRLLLESQDIYSRPWILITSMFLHSGFNHILFNMYGLLIFGPLLEQKIGPKRFLLIYLISGIFAGFFASFFYDRALGASGAIMGMLGTLIILMPDLKLLMFFVIPMPLWVAGIFWLLIDTFGIFVPSGVGNIAHLAGMGLGLLYGLYLKKESRKYHKKFEKKKHLSEFDMDEYLKTG